MNKMLVLYQINLFQSLISIACLLFIAGFICYQELKIQKLENEIKRKEN